MELREAKIIIPEATGIATISYAEQFMLDAWGGFTATVAEGAWRDGAQRIVREPSRVYTIAMPTTADSAVKLHRLAAIVADIGEQNCVYIRYTSGVVELVNSGGRYPWAGKAEE